MTKQDFEEERKRAQLHKDLEEYKKLEREAQIKESLEVIGNSLLSGLASVSSITADTLEKAVNDIKDSNKNSKLSDADKIKKRLALRKKQDVLKKYKNEDKRLKRKKNKIKFNLSLAVFLVLIAGFSVDFIFSVLAAAGTNFLVDKFYNPKRQPIGLSKEEIKHAPEYSELMKEANADLDKIFKCVEDTRDEEIQFQATKLYDRGLQILEYLQDHPEKISKSSRFLSYYLDTASNICDKYHEVEIKNVVNDNTIKATENAKRAMILLEKAFDNEFLKLMEDDIIDIETDVKVLENSMKWDNYMD